VGGDRNGQGQAGGVFDELTTFNCPLDQAGVTSGYPYPAILSQPVSVTVNNGSTATFQVAADNTGSFQWQLNGAGITGSDRVTGVAGSSLVVADVSDADAGNYSLIAGNGLTNITSAPAALTVNDTAQLRLVQ
jgi:hypothetical protein